MNNSKLHALTVVIYFFLIGQPSYSQSVTWNEDVRGWYIGVDRSVGDGCYMHSSFDGGGVLRTGFNVDGNSMFIIIGNRNWKSLEEGKYYPIEIQFGNRSPWSGEASVFVWDDGEKSLKLTVPFDDNSADNFVSEVQQTQNVIARYQGRQILNLSLRGSFAAMDEVLKCQDNILRNRSPSSDPFNSKGISGADPFH